MVAAVIMILVMLLVFGGGLAVALRSPEETDQHIPNHADVAYWNATHRR